MGIPLVETRNDTTLNLVNGHPHMTIVARCWVQEIRWVTRWETEACDPWPSFPTLDHSYSVVYHQAKNENFLGGLPRRHTVRHWIYADFIHSTGRRWATFYYNTQGNLADAFRTVILSNGSGGTC